MNRNQAPSENSSHKDFIRCLTEGNLVHQRAHQTPFANFLVETLQVISRTCNPLLFQNPESYLSFREEKFGGLWDWYDVSVGGWPVLYAALSDDLRFMLNNELKVDDRYSSLGEVLLKHSEDKSQNGKIELEIDPIQFWMWDHGW